MSSDPSRAPRKGAWGGGPSGWAARAHGGRITRDEAFDMAVEAVRTLDRAEVRRLFREPDILSLHRLDDHALARRLAHALVCGEVHAPDGEDAVEPQWIHIPALGDQRALLSTAEEVPGLDHYEIESLAEAAKVAGMLLADVLSRELLLDYIDEPSHARDRKIARAGDEAALADVCARLLYDREVNLFTPRRASGLAAPAPIIIAPRPPPPREVQSDHWIEIGLADDDGDPVAGEPYSITLPSGEVRTGVLDSDGKARLDGLKDGGSAQVSFPNIDGREWRVA